jgi:hypothetical protein
MHARPDKQTNTLTQKQTNKHDRQATASWQRFRAVATRDPTLQPKETIESTVGGKVL